MRPFTQFAIRYTEQGELQILDQILLPDEERWITAKDYKDMYDYIKRLSTRGAPMIGVAAVGRGGAGLFSVEPDSQSFAVAGAGSGGCAGCLGGAAAGARCALAGVAADGGQFDALHRSAAGAESAGRRQAD